jgi:cobaltochelatase CobN
MHLLATSSASLDETAEPVDLDRPPTDLIVLSFSDSDLLALSASGGAGIDLLNLRDLRHPMSVDLWIEKTARHAKLILVRLLGGIDWWRYGLERLRDEARLHGFQLAVLPGEDRDDPSLVDFSTLDVATLATLLGYFRAGGPVNMATLRTVLMRIAGGTAETSVPAQDLPAFGWYITAENPQAVAIFYRSMMLAGDTSPVDDLAAALSARGIRFAAAYVSSLKDPSATNFLHRELCDPDIILTMTAFGAGDLSWKPQGAALMQIVTATTRYEAWAQNNRGLAAADLAMHVVLPEIDGRVLGGVISFKDDSNGIAVNRSDTGQVSLAADRIAALIRLRQTPSAERRLMLLLPDYPGAGGREGYAVGLDVPGSVLTILSDLGIDSPPDAKTLMARLKAGDVRLPAEDYRVWFASLPQMLQAKVIAAWGEPKDDDYRFRATRCGNVCIALPPDRGGEGDRRATYHDPDLPPSHALLAFSLWMRRFDPHALIHLGAHGTLEWLPGKAVALTPECFPSLVAGALPVIYPFIVTNPGEAAQAKRRIAAVTLGHLPPQLAEGGLTGPAADLERLVDEYAQADGLDPRRRDRLAGLILEAARAAGLAQEAGAVDLPDGEALQRIDAWLCDIKDMAFQNGLHLYGRSGDQPDSAENERKSLMDALAGRFVPAGPAGAPARGRRDVFPTGRNLYTSDPRTLPTPTAMDMARKAVDEVIRLNLQEQGEVPRSLVIDLWGSATLRTGGEEIAQGLALLGCRPLWDEATGRVTGVEVLPPAVLDWPRVDVTFRISGLFRDLFPAQIALLDAAVKAVAARDESEADNPLAGVRAKGGSLARVFGAAPGVYGAGIEALLTSDWDASQADIGAAYLANAAYAYGGAEGRADHRPGEFAGRVATADLLIHGADDPYRDLLQGTGDAAHIGGFAAAQQAGERGGRVVVLDTSDPARPRPRMLKNALARIIRGRSIHPRHIEGLMRHGPRGAAEMAETVDRLADFARITGAVESVLFDLLYDAYVADPKVQAFLLDQNPDAGKAIADRLAWARQVGLWQPLRNDLSPLEALR